jgi:hypothetical protein
MTPSCPTRPKASRAIRRKNAALALALALWSVAAVSTLPAQDPRLLGAISTRSPISGAYNSAFDPATNFAYIAASDADSLSVMDMTVPFNPTLLGTISHPLLDGAFDIAFDSVAKMAYVSSKKGLLIIDVSIPAKPFLVGSLIDSILSDANGVAFDPASNHVFVTSYRANGLAVVDVSDPTSPILLGTLPFQYAYIFGSAYDIVFDSIRNLVYIACVYSDTLAIVDVSNPTGLKVLGFFRDSVLDGIYNIAFDPTTNLVYAICAFSNTKHIRIVDVSNYETPFLFKSFLLPEFNQILNIELDVDAKQLYVASHGSRFLVVDISNPAIPALMGLLIDPILLINVDIVLNKKSNHIYLIGGNLKILNISDLANITVEGIFFVGTNSLDEVSDIVLDPVTNLAYAVSEMRGRLSIIDVSNPVAPILLSSIYAEGGRDIIFDPTTNRVYTRNLQNLQITDVSNPISPQLLGSIIIDEGYFRIIDLELDSNNQIMYINNGGIFPYEHKLISIDVSNPEMPIINYTPLNDFSGYYIVYFDLNSKKLLVGTSNYNFMFIDVTDPLNPNFSPIFSVNNFYTSNDYILDSSNNYFYTITLGNELAIWDMSNPNAPVQLGRLNNFPLDFTGIALDPDAKRVYMVSGEGATLSVIEASNPAEPFLLRTFTHPILERASGIAFNPETNCVYVVSSETDSLAVIDVSGQPVLLSGFMMR